ncbi:MAG: hypothetical protein LPJ89_10760 [Hymenobacteraceae bacterium]|nr:hypothetical protein [Hymenobacteraceae bacterium]MDX5395855.1 hypothetical protein [Hymenobacteraceae bacterium]MDX5444248.1 hypothetical protein [Hymenobacteraceae bacterium]MDX5511910.1 hypothetical protein [Hymenobacteraceae bacterium]
MKNLVKFSFVAAAAFAFTFTSCDSNTAEQTEESIETTTEETINDVETAVEPTDTIVVEDTTVNDGVADEIKEETPGK